jgi:hypothetical protein
MRYFVYKLNFVTRQASFHIGPIIDSTDSKQRTLELIKPFYIKLDVWDALEA